MGLDLSRISPALRRSSRSRRTGLQCFKYVSFFGVEKVQVAALQLSIDELMANDVRKNEDGILSLFAFRMGEVCRDCELRVNTRYMQSRLMLHLLLPMSLISPLA